MAVRGIDGFREFFKDYVDSFAVIGGCACAEWCGQMEVDFRATQDVDMVLLLESKAFYLWQLKPEIQLAKVPAADMAQHLSQNQGRGAWCSVEIPFSAFSTLFGEGGGGGLSMDRNTGVE